MATRVLTTPEDFKTYDHWIKNHPHGSLWQSLEWKEYQEQLGREMRVYTMSEDSSTPSPLPSPQGGGKIISSALVVIDRTTFGLSTWDIPRGPLWINHQSPITQSPILEQIIQDAKKDKCISLFVSPPEQLKAMDSTISPQESYKLKASYRHEQPAATRVIDLIQSDDDILRHMKPKGRYNIGVAEKHGVEVRESRNTDAFYELLTGTSERDGFKTLPKKHYKAFLEDLPGSFLLLAYQGRPPPLYPPPPGGVTRKPIAGLMGVCWGTQGIYYYGASDYAYRALMAPYLLQWEAMRCCKAKGCRIYDLLGVLKSEPLPLTPSLREGEALHPWSGVSKFKEQFGGSVVQYSPEQELVLKPLIKKLLTFKRRFL